MSKLAALALFCFAGSLDPIDVAWQPRAGSKLERTFEITTELRSELTELLIDGKDLGEDEGFSFSSESRRKYGIVDELVEIGPDRPTKLVRHYEALERVDEKVTLSDGESETETIEFESDLEGKRVSFEWEPKSKAWKRAFAGDDVGDDELLEKLAEDMDLRAFLPGSALEVGGQYEVDAKALEALLMPGGDLGLRPEGGDTFGSKFRRRLDQAVLGGLKGKLRARLAGMREIDGQRCAVIELEGEVQAKGEGEFEEATKTSFELELEPRGELVWDLGALRAHSLELTAEMSFDVKSVTTSEDGGETSTMEDRTKLVGTTRLAAKFQAR